MCSKIRLLTLFFIVCGLSGYFTATTRCCFIVRSGEDDSIRALGACSPQEPRVQLEPARLSRGALNSHLHPLWRVLGSCCCIPQATLASASSSGGPAHLHLPTRPRRKHLTTFHSTFAHTRCVVGLGGPSCSREGHGEGSCDRTCGFPPSLTTLLLQPGPSPSLSPFSSLSIGSKISILVLENICFCPCGYSSVN